MARRRFCSLTTPPRIGTIANGHPGCSMSNSVLPALPARRARNKLVSFLRTWIDLKLWHVQFNIINKETLLAARGSGQVP